MANVLTEESVLETRAWCSNHVPPNGAEVRELCDSHEELRAQRDRLREALREAEQRARQFPANGASCLICAAYGEREFGRVSVDIPHRPTCPFAVLSRGEETR